jgi:hypothetical protein
LSDEQNEKALQNAASTNGAIELQRGINGNYTQTGTSAARRVHSAANANWKVNRYRKMKGKWCLLQKKKKNRRNVEIIVAWEVDLIKKPLRIGN